MAYDKDTYAGTEATPSRFDEERAYAEKKAYAAFAQAQCNAVPAPDENYIVEQLFTYHPANQFTQPKFETIREAAKYFAKVLFNNVPAGADRTAAIRKLREAVMTANAGISLGGLSL
jgi:hypothetical protein